MMARELTLIIPGLFNDPEKINKQEFKRFPAWDKFLQYADFTAGEAKNIDHVLFKLFNLAWTDDPPLAALRALGDSCSVQDSSWWMCADPVQLEADQSAVYLIGNQHLKISKAEEDQLLAALNKFLAADNLQLIAKTSTHWYLNTAADPQIRGKTFDELKGKNLNDALPVGLAQKKWRQLLTELQMILHNSEVNQLRAQQGKPVINSLWLWGMGQLPSTIHSDYLMVLSNYAIARGLASAAAIENELVPEHIDAIFNILDHRPNFLIVMNDLREANSDINSERGQNFIATLEKNWLKPALTALKNKQLARVTLYLENGAYFELTRANLARWWRKWFRDTGKKNEKIHHPA